MQMLYQITHTVLSQEKMEFQLASEPETTIMRREINGYDTGPMCDGMMVPFLTLARLPAAFGT